MATQLLECFEVVSLTHVPRMENQEANELTQIASRYKVSKEKLKDFIEIKEKMVSNFSPSPNMAIPKTRGTKVFSNKFLEIFKKIARHEVFAIYNLSQSDWRKPIIEYLENPFKNTDRKIKYRALSYVRLGNELLKKTLEGILLKCLGNTETYLAISEVYNGTCGAHQAGHKMK
ncbi:uncharacterized protein LOC127136387 [Lathyrus oleraceus]|uniref:uncharacterized protein LOC127136387 n=1 Tax=Pisum sativum TaxID=3888 RepID=UPI0021D2A973|nr:uncharacterized protein LOC127136387 [Pisum sativum]